MTNRFNCLTNDSEIEQFSAFYVAPVRNDRPEADGETDMVQCETGEAEIWTIYGSNVTKDGCEWMAVHDAETAFEIVRIARQINLEQGKPFFFRDTAVGCLPTHGARIDFIDIAEALTEEIHDALPDRPAEDFREDDFESHPLSEIREAFVMFSNYWGEDAACDPYDTSEAA